jgi:hypothetical protein
MGAGGLAGLVLLAGLTVAAVYLSTAFVIGYAQVPTAPKTAAGSTSGR